MTVVERSAPCPSDFCLSISIAHSAMPPKRETPKVKIDDALFKRIYAVVRQVPRGQVATYGQIALVAGLPSARIAGHAMAALPAGSKVPWHRVLNSQGRISLRKEGGSDREQRRRLQAEGVHFDGKGRVDFGEVGWEGPRWSWLEKNGFDIEELALRSQQKRRTGAWRRWRL